MKCFHDLLTEDFEDNCRVRQVPENRVCVVHCSAYLIPCTMGTFYMKVSLSLRKNYDPPLLFCDQSQIVFLGASGKDQTTDYLRSTH